MAQHAIYCYAWDLAETGVAEAAALFAAQHINTITLAGAYHAGKFLRPGGQNGKIYFPEDGTVYFKHSPERYGLLQPQPNSLLAEHDIFSDSCSLAAFETNAWMVLLHNSRLGQLHPEVCVRNAFGDRYIYSLCPSEPAVQDYAIAICQDVTETYPVARLCLETPGFLPFQHGYHHEFSLIQQNSWLENMLGLCFCPQCLTGSAAAGIDSEALHNRVKQSVEKYLASDIDFSDDMATAFWTADIVTDPDLQAFLGWRCRVVETLLRNIREAVRDDAAISVIPSVARPTAGAWGEGSDLSGLADIVEQIDVCFYEPSLGRVAADFFDIERRLGDMTAVGAILRPSHPDLPDATAVKNAVAFLAGNGIRDIGFYNFGHLRRASLDWAGSALAALP